MHHSGQDRGGFGMTRGQITILAVLAVLGLVVVIGGGYYVLADSGIIGANENEVVARPPTTRTPIPSDESSPTSAPDKTAGKLLPPTWTPTPFGLSEIDYAQWSLRLSDLPEGFKISPVEAFDSESGLIGEDGRGTMVNSFAFTKEGDDSQFVFGITGLILEHEQQEFDAQISRPEMSVEEVVNSLDHNGILEQEEIGGLEDLGDVAVGYHYLLDMEGIELRLNVIVFRRDIAGVMMFTGYVDGYPEAASVRELAYTLDQRILPTLPKILSRVLIVGAGFRSAQAACRNGVQPVYD
jgi:hypothetical protein